MIPLTSVLSAKNLVLPFMVVRKSVYTLILFTLIAFKVTSLTIHIQLHHEHQDNHEESCELCEDALSILNTEFSTTGEIPAVEEHYKTDFHSKVEAYESVCATPFFDNSLLVRPPPSLKGVSA